MKKISFLIILLSFFMNSVSVAAEKSPEKTKATTKTVKKSAGNFGKRSLARFNNVDADKNGSVSEAEFMSVQKQAFIKKDKDKNKSLSKAEFSPTLAKAVKGTGARSLARFNKVDTDKNGSISESEFMLIQKQAFVRKDKDKNKSLSKAEFSPTLAKIKS